MFVEKRRTIIVEQQNHFMARIKNRTKYRGPRKLLAAMTVAPKKKVRKVNKYLYSMHHLLDGRSVRRRRLNPDYNARV